MTNFAIRRLLPYALRAPLWGNRKRWGLTVQEEDPCWQQWTETYTEFYRANQRAGIGQYVNDAGYRVMSDITLNGKSVLEIGAGDIRHMKHWKGKPAEYVLADVSSDMMAYAAKCLKDASVSASELLVKRNEPLDLAENSVD